MNTENKPVYFTKEQLKQHLEARGINTNEKARPIIDALAAKGAVIEGFNDQKQPNLAQSVLGGVVKPTMDLIGAGFAGVGALGNRLGQQGTEFVAGQLDNLINSTGGFDGEQTFSERARGIQQPSSIGQAYANQSQQVRESAANPISQTITGQNIRPAENLKELGGDVLQTAALAVPGGVTLKGASTLAKIGGGAAYGTLGGGAFGAGQAMSNNETLEDILKSGAIGAGLGATLGAAIPAVPVAVNALRKTPEVANDVYSATKNLRSNLQSYVGSKTVEPQFGTAATRLTGSATRLESPLASYSKYLPQAEKAMADIKVDEPISLVGSQIGDKFKEVVSLRRDVGNTMGQELKTVGKLKTNIEPIFENFEKALFENGLTYNGLSKKIIANDLSKVAPDDIALIEDFVQELNRIGAKPSVAQIDALISRVTDKINYAKSAKGMTSTTNGERLVKGALNSLRSKFDEVPELAKYAEARKNYAELSNFIDEGASFLGNVTQSGDFAKDASLAKSAVQSILNNGKKDWLLKLEALTDYPALDESILALQAMKDAGNYKGLSLLETLSDGAIPTSKAGFTQKILDYVMEKGTRVVAGTPGERTKAYLKSLEMSGNKVPKTSIKTNTPTPKSGLTNIPSSKGIKKSNVDIKETIPQSTKAATKVGEKSIPKELQPLAEEARKYKSAEEFVKAQPTAYRGEGGSNVAQGKALLAEGKHFASDAEYPKGFGKVGEYVLKPNAKVLDLGDSTFAEISQKLGIPERIYISPKELSTIAKEKGYDVVKYTGEYKSTGKQFSHTVDLTGDSYITKSQLTDIWNKTNKKVTLPKSKDLSTELVQQAKKYKSAEEFVKAKSGNQGIYDKEYDNMIQQNRAEARPLTENEWRFFEAETKDDKVKIYRLTTNGEILPGDNVSIYDVSKFINKDGSLNITGAKMGITQLGGKENVKLTEMWIPKKDLYQTPAGTQVYAPKGLKSLIDLWNKANGKN